MKNTITTLLFLFIISISHSQILVQKISDNRFIERKDNKYGIIDSLKNTIVPFKYDLIEYKNERLIFRKDKLHGLFNLDNQELLPIEYKYILPRKHNRFLLWKTNSVNGLSDINGKIIIPVKYKGFSSTNNDDFYITKNENNLSGVYDSNGINIIPEKYIFYTIDNYRLFASKNGKPQIINLLNPDSTVVLDERIEFVRTVKHSSMGERFFQIIKRDNKYGVINSANETIVPIIYDEIKSSQNWKYFIIKTANKVGLIHVNGTVIKEPIYDSMQLRKEIIVLKRKKFNDEYYSYK